MALTVFGTLLMLVPTLFAAALPWVFSPAAFLALLDAEPIASAVSPLVSQFAQAGIFAGVFAALLLLIAGRYAEQALGGAGTIVAFVAGAYGGALARLLLTQTSLTPGFSASGGCFALIGAYLMLYGIPRALPLNLRGSRPVQIAALALVWALLQIVFGLAGSALDWSTGIVEPLGGLAVGAALARPLLGWRYRKA